jgi:hypothetical protein
VLGFGSAEPFAAGRAPVLSGRGRAALIVLGLVGSMLAGCVARVGPARVAGDPAPVTLPASAGAGSSSPPASGTSGSRPTGSGTATPTSGREPTLPVAYSPEELTAAGIAVTMRRPAGWRRLASGGRVDFRDDTDEVLLRLEISVRTSDTLRAAAESLDRSTRASLAQYRLLGITPVTGASGPAVDWEFTFVRDGVTRQVVDRLSVSGDAGVAVYYSAPVRYFERMKPVWDAAVGDISVR